MDQLVAAEDRPVKCGRVVQFQAAVELNPKLAVAHSKIGYIERHQGNYEAAAESYETAVKLNPSSFDDTVSLAQIYQQLVRLADALGQDGEFLEAVAAINAAPTTAKTTITAR